MSIWGERAPFRPGHAWGDGARNAVVIDGTARDITPAPRPDLKALAQSYIDKAVEDWTWCDPDDVKRLARAVLEYD